MKPLSPLQSPEWLLAFDFDGTLANSDDSPSVPRNFFDLIEELRANHNSLWGINTGRSLMQTVQGISEAQFPFLPDFIIAREREIYTPNNYGRWVSVADWNKRCDKAHVKLFRKYRRLLRQIQDWVGRETAAVWGQQEGEPAGMIASTASEMDFIVNYINEQIVNLPLLSYQRNGIYLRFSHADYHKGSALAEVGRLSVIPFERIFAIGDSHNDIDMLDPSIAANLACPANACEEVKRQIMSHGGYIARGIAGHGTIEALVHLFSKSQENTGGGNRTRTSEETGF